MSGDGPAASSALAAGLAGRCPRCGRGRLFRGFLAVLFVVVGAALVVEVAYGWPVWLLLLVWLPLSLVLCLVMLRPLKGALIGLQFRHRLQELDAGGF